MGLFFKTDKDEQSEKKNSYLEDQKALFDTKGEEKPKVIDNSYDEYVFKKKEYNDVPKYKASTSQKVGVVVDKEDFGYQDLNPEIQTIDLQKRNLHEDLHEIVNNAPIDESTEENHTSIYDDNLKKEIQSDEQIEVIDVDNGQEVVVADVIEENLDKSKKLSIFGNSDEPIQAKVYEVKEAPRQEKVEIVDVDLNESTKKVDDGIRFNENGNKICPQCGAPLDPNAPSCFLCGYKF